MNILSNAVPGRRTPTFTAETMPAALTKHHRTTVWAELVVLQGAVQFVDDGVRNVVVAAGGRLAIVPDVYHHIEPSDDACFYIQFYDNHRE
ncbi:MAG: DUF1971 domain-containing protein [bacterium]|nr:DUF1971 domain-containing protein [bacterium]